MTSDRLEPGTQHIRARALMSEENLELLEALAGAVAGFDRRALGVYMTHLRQRSDSRGPDENARIDRIAKVVIGRRGKDEIPPGKAAR